jgi:hypothetical protein
MGTTCTMGENAIYSNYCVAISGQTSVWERRIVGQMSVRMRRTVHSTQNNYIGPALVVQDRACRVRP